MLFIFLHGWANAFFFTNISLSLRVSKEKIATLMRSMNINKQSSIKKMNGANTFFSSVYERIAHNDNHNNELLLLVSFYAARILWMHMYLACLLESEAMKHENNNREEKNRRDPKNILSFYMTNQCITNINKTYILDLNLFLICYTVNWSNLFHLRKAKEIHFIYFKIKM